MLQNEKLTDYDQQPVELEKDCDHLLGSADKLIKDLNANYGGLVETLLELQQLLSGRPNLQAKYQEKVTQLKEQLSLFEQGMSTNKTIKPEPGEHVLRINPPVEQGNLYYVDPKYRKEVFRSTTPLPSPEPTEPDQPPNGNEEKEARKQQDRETAHRLIAKYSERINLPTIREMLGLSVEATADEVISAAKIATIELSTPLPSLSDTQNKKRYIRNDKGQEIDQYSEEELADFLLISRVREMSQKMQHATFEYARNRRQNRRQERDNKRVEDALLIFKLTQIKTDTNIVSFTPLEILLRPYKEDPNYLDLKNDYAIVQDITNDLWYQKDAHSKIDQLQNEHVRQTVEALYPRVEAKITRMETSLTQQLRTSLTQVPDFQTLVNLLTSYSRGQFPETTLARGNQV